MAIKIAEILKDHEKDKQVVDAQRFFDDVAGEEFKSFLFAPGIINSSIEDQRKQDPHSAPGCRLFDGNRMGLAVKYAQVDGEHPQDENIEGYP